MKFIIYAGIICHQLMLGCRSIEGDSSVQSSPGENYPFLRRVDDGIGKIDQVFSQGAYVEHEIDPYKYFEWSDGKNRSLQLMLLDAEMNNVSRFESIVLDSGSNTIRALPMSDNSGINKYQLFAKGSGDNSSLIPYEVLVVPNKFNPNHKLVIHLEFNYILFEAYLKIRIEFLRVVSVLLGDGGRLNNLTLDSYENTTTGNTSQMLVRISNNTIGYFPCDASQISRVQNMFNLLAKGFNHDEKGELGTPREGVSDVMAIYGITLVELELIGPCYKYSQSSSKDTMNLSWLRTVVPAVVITVLVVLFGVLTVFLYRRRKLRNGGGSSMRRNGTLKNAAGAANRIANGNDITSPGHLGVKSKHIPIIFADELDEYSMNQTSAVAPLIMKNEKPPATPSPVFNNNHMNNNHFKSAANSVSATPVNGPASMYTNSVDDFQSREGSMSLRTHSVASSHLNYSPCQYRPPPPYKPPSKSIIPQ